MIRIIHLTVAEKNARHWITIFSLTHRVLLFPTGFMIVFDNKGYITLGTSRDTSEFVCDNILYYW